MLAWVIYISLSRDGFDFDLACIRALARKPDTTKEEAKVAYVNKKWLLEHGFTHAQIDMLYDDDVDEPNSDELLDMGVSGTKPGVSNKYKQRPPRKTVKLRNIASEAN